MSLTMLVGPPRGLPSVYVNPFEGIWARVEFLAGLQSNLFKIIFAPEKLRAPLPEYAELKLCARCPATRGRKEKIRFKF